MNKKPLHWIFKVFFSNPALNQRDRRGSTWSTLSLFIVVYWKLFLFIHKSRFIFETSNNFKITLVQTFKHTIELV